MDDEYKPECQKERKRLLMTEYEDGEAPRPKDWNDLREKDLRHCESVAGHWLSFSISKAKWVTITSNAHLRKAFHAPVDWSSIDSLDEWTTGIQQAIAYYVLLDLIMVETERVQQFQSLGRGWVFVLLAPTPSERYGRLKVWFESAERVRHDHRMDMRAAELVGATRDKYLFGYNPEAEIVFFIKGIARGRPLVCIQRLRPDYRDLDKWAISTEAKVKCLLHKLPSDEERGRVVKKHKRRKRQKNRGRARDKELRAAEREAAERAITELLRISGKQLPGHAAADLDATAAPATANGSALAAAASSSSAAASTASATTHSADDVHTDEGQGVAAAQQQHNADPASTLGANGNSKIIRSVITAFGHGLLRRIRADGTLVLDLAWGGSHAGRTGDGGSEEVPSPGPPSSSSHDLGGEARHPQGVGAGRVGSGVGRSTEQVEQQLEQDEDQEVIVLEPEDGAAAAALSAVEASAASGPSQQEQGGNGDSHPVARRDGKEQQDITPTQIDALGAAAGGSGQEQREDEPASAAAGLGNRPPLHAPTGGTTRYIRQLFMPAPYTGVLDVETWDEFEEKRRRDKLDQQIAGSEDLFEQLLAEAKRAEGLAPPS